MDLADAQTKNVEIIKNVLANARFGKLHLIEHLFADDFVLHNAPGLPFGGDYVGWDGYVAQCEKLDTFWSSAVHSEREYVPVGDDKVFIHFWIDRAIAHNGQHVKMPIVAIWNFRDGKVTEIRPFFFDTKQIADLAAK